MKPDTVTCQGGPLDGQRMPVRWAGEARVVPRMRFTPAIAYDEPLRLELHRYEPVFARDDRAVTGARLVAFRYLGRAPA